MLASISVFLVLCTGLLTQLWMDELIDDDEGSSDQYIFYYALLLLLSSHIGLPVISQTFWDFPDLSV